MGNNNHRVKFPISRSSIWCGGPPFWPHHTSLPPVGRGVCSDGSLQAPSITPCEVGQAQRTRYRSLSATWHLDHGLFLLTMTSNSYAYTVKTRSIIMQGKQQESPLYLSSQLQRQEAAVKSRSSSFAPVDRQSSTGNFCCRYPCKRPPPPCPPSSIFCPPLFINKKTPKPNKLDARRPSGAGVVDGDFFFLPCLLFLVQYTT